MPIILKLGLTKKIGQPDYGSLAASCYVEVEVDSHLLQGDLEGFHRQARSAYAACSQAVSDELARGQTRPENSQNHRHGTTAARSHNRTTSSPTNHTRGRSSQGTPRSATNSQVRAIEAIAKREQLDLISILREQFDVQAAGDLSIGEASALIDQLKETANQGGAR